MLHCILLLLTYLFLQESGSERYNEFLEVLGEKIELKGWKKYAGGLDTEGFSTGTHSVYRPYFSLGSKYEIMFHISTMLPFYEDDLQHVCIFFSLWFRVNIFL